MKWIETEETVRFNEVDEWGMAWHGHYVSWFEVGRMDLLKRFDLMPVRIFEMGFIAPIVSLKCDYKRSAKCGDRIIIRTTAIKPETASLIFRFEILLQKSRILLAKGETMQVLLTTDKTMIYRIEGEIKKRIDALITYCKT